MRQTGWNRKAWAIGVLALMPLSAATASSPSTVPDVFTLHAAADILPDPGNDFDIDTVTRPPVSGQFTPGAEQLPEIGPTRTPHWLRVPLPAALNDGQWLLRVDEVELNQLCVFWPVDGGGTESTCSGLDRRHLAGRNWHSDYLFDVPSTLDTSRPLHVLAQSNTWLTVPLEAVRLDAFMAQDHHREFRWGLYHGALISLVVITLLAWLELRAPMLLLFALQHLAFLFVSFGWQGRPMEYAGWPAAAWWTANAPAVALALYVLLGVGTHQLLLHTRGGMPRLHKAGNLLMAASLLAAAAGAVLPIWGYWALGPIGLGYVLLILAFTLTGIAQGIGAARYALTSIAVMLAAVLLKSFEALGIEVVPPHASLALLRLGALVSGLFMLIALGVNLRAVQREKEAAEAALLRRSEELEQINVELLEFAYVASHDLKEPLRSINGFARLLQRHYADALDDKGRDYLTYVADGAGRANRLITDLMEYTDARNTPLGIQPVDTAQRVQATWARATGEHPDVPAELHTDTLPTVQADPERLDSVFYELLDNALTHTAKGRPPKVTVTCEQKAGDWKFTVADNGPGIPDNNLRRIFTLFHRQDREDVERTGAGLAICKKAVQRHGGRLWAESDDSGSQFHFTLPVEPLDGAYNQSVS